MDKVYYLAQPRNILPQELPLTAKIDVTLKTTITDTKQLL